ncbi:hypothetical protein AB6A40_010410 [Gnathostoma spinigerum]|uniref:BPTI/Kunitz inhibitor domain-containing protein n=1 Tax=Gnathostoma spinigerum TaxID=75299 RepID=A0ABD6EWH1_9BILA
MIKLCNYECFSTEFPSGQSSGVLTAPERCPSTATAPECPEKWNYYFDPVLGRDTCFRVYFKNDSENHNYCKDDEDGARLGMPKTYGAMAFVYGSFISRSISDFLQIKVSKMIFVAKCLWIGEVAV